MATDEWAFRWHALTALSALPQPEARSELQKLLHVSSVETRYGAVRSLTQRGESEGEMSIERFGKTGENFAMNTVFSTAEPVVHVARYKAPEIVVFNPEQTFQPGLIFVAKGWTIKTRSDETVEMTHYRPNNTGHTVRCSTMVTDVIRNMGQMNANYSLVVQLLRQAASENLMEGRLVIDALPEANRAYSGSNSESELPEMFAGGESSKSQKSYDIDETLAEINDMEQVKEESTFIGKFKSITKGR